MQHQVAQAIAALDETRLSGHVFSADWRLAHVTDAQRIGTGADPPLGAAAVSPEFRAAHLASDTAIADEFDAHVRRLVPFMLATVAGGRAALREVAAPEYVDAVESEEPRDPPPLWTSVMTVVPRGFQRYPLRAVISRIDGS